MKGCLQIIVVVVVVLIVGNIFFDFLDGLQRFLDSIPWWVWLIGVLVFIGIATKE